MEHQLPFFDDYPNRSIFSSLIFMANCGVIEGGNHGQLVGTFGIQKVEAFSGLWIDLMGWIAMIKIVKVQVQPRSKKY